MKASSVARRTIPNGERPVPCEPASPAIASGGYLAAEVLTGGAVNASVAQLYLPHLDGADGLRVLMDVMQGHAKAVSAGDLSHLEGMLLMQAVALQSMFVDLASRAKRTRHREWQQLHTTLALKAAAQSRQAIEALGELRSPKSVLFAKQANVSNGPQQINNAATPILHSAPARLNGDLPNELLGIRDEERMDARTSGPAGQADPRVETLDPVHRTPKR